MNEKTMTPSQQEVISDGQINKAVEQFRFALLKSRSEFGIRDTQIALGCSGLDSRLLSAFHKHVSIFGNMIVHYVNVNRKCEPQDILDTTERHLLCEKDVVKNMPHGQDVNNKGYKTPVYYFKPENVVLSDDELEKEYELRDLEAADPYSLIADNEACPTFGDDHPNVTHWKDAHNKWCYVSCSNWNGERSVAVYRREDVSYNNEIWFAGIRKPKSNSKI